MEAEIWGAEIWDWNIVDPAEFRSGAKDQRPAMAHEAMAHEAMAHKRLLLERSPIRLMRQQQTSHNLVEEKRQSLGAIEDSANARTQKCGGANDQPSLDGHAC